MGIECWSEVLEFPIGNPVLVGYLAYIVGLLIAIAAAKTETAEPGKRMSTEVKYCFESDEIGDLAQNMADEQVRRLPLLNDKNRVVGIVSLGDLATSRDGRSLLITRISRRRYPTSPKLVATTVQFFRIAKGSAPARQPTLMLRSRSSVLSNETPV
jgi:CBS-domain-containing membrane protein